MVALSRMTVTQLADYADKELCLPERQCWRFEGGPLPRAALLANIEREQERRHIERAAELHAYESQYA